MKTLRLRNCTRFQLEYWRGPNHTKNFVAPGDEGEYRWGSSYTLFVQRTEQPYGKARRPWVYQGGVYYAFWLGETVRILSTNQMMGVDPNGDNPWADKWKGVVKPYDFLPKWECIDSRRNDTDVSQDFVFEVEDVLTQTESTVHGLTVTEATEIGLELSSEFSIEGVGKVGAGMDTNYSSGSDVTDKHLEQSEKTDREKATVSFTLEPYQSRATWQLEVDVWGNTLKLPSFVYTKSRDDSPTDKPEPIKLYIRDINALTG